MQFGIKVLPITFIKKCNWAQAANKWDTNSFLFLSFYQWAHSKTLINNFTKMAYHDSFRYMIILMKKQSPHSLHLRS